MVICHTFARFQSFIWTHSGLKFSSMLQNMGFVCILKSLVDSETNF